MKALILAAGYGTRLLALGEGRPKALLDINNKPLINYTLEKIQSLANLNEVLVVTNDKFHTHFEDWAKAQKKFPYPIRVINDGTKTPEERLGSVGDMNFVLKKTNLKDDLLVIGGDNLFDYELTDYLEFSKNKKTITIGLYDIGDLNQAPKFGVVSLDQKCKIINFEEKPKQPKSTLIAMCCYYLPANSLGLIQQYLNESGKSDTAGDFIRWVSQKIDVYGFKFIGKWYDIGSIESYHEAQKAFANK